MATKQAIDPGTHQLRDVTDNDVVWNGEIVGTDPDPNIRAQLLREAQQGSGSTGGSDAAG